MISGAGSSLTSLVDNQSNLQAGSVTGTVEAGIVTGTVEDAMFYETSYFKGHLCGCDDIVTSSSDDRLLHSGP